MKKDISIGVIGSGTMGSGIAQITAKHQLNVLLFDVEKDVLSSNIKRIHSRFDRLVEKGKMSEDECEDAKKNILPTTKLEEMADCAFVIEAAPEKIDVKKEIFKKLDEVCGEHTILATNTSSFSVTEIGSITNRPDRVAGMHFFNPVPLMPLVEIVKGEKTSQQTIDLLVDLGELVNKLPVTCKDTPGFIVNRVARPYYNEALKISNERLASIEQIDKIMKVSGGFKMGPFELQDLIGIDINYTTTESVYGGFFGDSRFRPSYDQQRKVQAGTLGKKSGGGFYNYEA
ncbi:3-hydroxyacyl-CoA dehydrogenase NAD-binding domain-containing protein [Domibacillus epiphyticus]|uniref:3-hydroxybutyryl-CoA dehydrogenase n=1 Tax=Domibacillus epiphyticus TaxID=1714355 RepID=A0A1V2A8H2_9BACI|nr:3-hydroxyacyl-CoA dehydrogenase NAD-binding domain-containing protein [Domibacillus epiphyticus]OMP67299.1 3-hydroxybutyryl-CoA dehydrogenase [Domibacillus epiphyticus]